MKNPSPLTPQLAPYLLGLYLCFANTVSFAQQVTFPNEETMKPGQCYSLPDSKKYLDALIQHPNASVILEIGPEKISRVHDTATTDYFFCKLKCKDTSGHINTLWATHSDNSANHADMNGFLCAGVRVENKQIVGSIYGPQPVIYSFWSFDTSLPEVREWLLTSQYQMNSEDFQEKLVPLRTTMNYIAAAYITSTSAVMKEAGMTLSRFAEGTPEGTSALINYAAQLAQKKWILETNYTSSDFFVANMIKTHGRFLEFAPAPK